MMRIRKVAAHAFGPLVDETLEFADGMTVVVGDNESAKSSWHAAIFAALCGRRRARGRRREDDQRFSELHRPWDDPDDWLASAEIVLDDGRLIEMRQDLAGGVDCHARDLQINRDVSAEVMNDGTPDAARWLGLDRASFATTACIEQAQMLRVRAAADGLQEHLQRAAATAGADATAAAALDHITVFERDHVGLARSNSSKPLRRALDAVRNDGERLELARRSHDEYVRLARQADELGEAARRAEAVVRAHEAAHEALQARELAARFARAAQLREALSDKPPASIAEDDALTRQVVEALTAWRSRPAEPVLTGASSAQLQAQLSALPPPPQGDPEVHETVRRALERLQSMDSQLRQLEADRPVEPTAAGDIAAGDDELVDLARTLDGPLPPVDPALVTAEAAARRNLQAARATTHTANLILVMAGVVAAAGIAWIASGTVVTGGILLAVAALITGFGLLRRRSGPVDVAVRRHADAQAELGEARRRAAEVSRRRENAVRRCGDLRVDADPLALRRAAGARARATSYADDLQRWDERHREREKDRASAAADLATALLTRGHEARSSSPDALAAAVQSYRDACSRRAEQANGSRRREPLQARLEARQRDEERAVHDKQKRVAAARLVAEAGRACGCASDSTEVIASALDEWMRRRGEQVKQAEETQEQRTELQALLNGRSLDQLGADATSATQRAEALKAGVDPELLAAVDPAGAERRLPALREEATEAAKHAADACGDLRRFAQSVASVAEAEEALDAAEEELRRVQALQQTLTLTRRFLGNAQDRVHRDIAPVLAATVRRWLPTVTAGRYTDVTVNPTTLQVNVRGRGGRWRTADLLSYGTAEQVYLLLRVALAEHLTGDHDTCPLILDDVTVHADAVRTREILDLLLTIAADRQVIVFTQEQQVATWAREHLRCPEHGIRTLPTVAAS